MPAIPNQCLLLPDLLKLNPALQLHYNLQHVMSVIRTDPLTGFTTIFAPERAKRPIAIRNSDVQNISTSEQIESDPFAEGKETETTPEVYAVRPSNSESNQPGWRLRVVANKYPALTQIVDMESEHNAYGVHEVIVESAQFETQVSRLGFSQFQEIFRAYRQRISVHRDDPQLNYALIFKNEGILGGASMGHVHSQLMASQFIPQSIVQELHAAKEYQIQNGISLFETFSQKKDQEYSGLVISTQHFDVICPYASRFAYETWIIPRSLKTHFDQSSDQEIDDLADISRQVLRALEQILGTHDLNYAIQAPPFDTSEQAGYTWSMRIFPRLSHLAGFELATSMFINPVFPEQAIERLKKQLAP